MALKCEFKSGVFHAWGEQTKINSDPFVLVYDSIDVKARTARLIGNIGTSDILVLETPGHLTFVEPTKSGNMTITTVYRSSKDGPYSAVHSRHVGMLSSPMASQMYGTCASY
jgi:hypothetical protein